MQRGIIAGSPGLLATEGWHDRVEKLAEVLLQEARIPTDERLRAVLERAPAEHKALVSYINNHIFDHDLSVKAARAATGVRSPGLNLALGGVKSFAAYVGKARIETAERMISAGEAPLGCIMKSVGIGSYWTFVRHWKEHSNGALSHFDVPHLIETSFDVVTWHHLVNGSLTERADALAYLLHKQCPAAFDLLPLPRRVEDGILPRPESIRSQEENILADFAAATQRPLRYISWAVSAAGVDYGGLFRYLSKNIFSLNRENLQPLTLASAMRVVPLNDSSPSSRVKFMIGESWGSFRDKRLVEVALGLLPRYGVASISNILGISEKKLDEIFLQRTGLTIFKLEELIGRTAGHPDFEAWIKAGTTGVHEKEARSIMALLEGSLKGSCARLVISQRKTEAEAVSIIAGNSNAGNIDKKDWTLLGAVAEALDYTAHDRRSHENFLEGVLSGSLRDEVIDLFWLACRLTDGQKPSSYREAIEDLRSASLRNSRGRRSAAVWRNIYNYKHAPATPERSQWLDLALIDADSKMPVTGLLAAYRAIDIIIFQRTMQVAESFVSKANEIVSLDDDPWIVSEVMNITARLNHELGRQDVALALLAESLEIAYQCDLTEQVAITVIETAFQKTLYGQGLSPDLREKLAFLDDKWISERIRKMVRMQVVQDTVYFATELKHSELAMQFCALEDDFKENISAMAWVTTLRGLYFLRTLRFHDAVLEFAEAQRVFMECKMVDKTNWLNVFLSLGLYATGHATEATSHASAAADFFINENTGDIRRRALQCLHAPTGETTAEWARTMICPRAPVDALAKGSSWGAISPAHSAALS